ncbi:DUF58 domain-containing protein [Paenibacillus sp. TRM 82003]|uniref:DUF58 domain-containing protein n=1 Tax=Kineococcus sp. TRM81007 TaxID=2925831 RepID=UPI001F57042B|nr:DUF58 domain-containing protein [Kineococcus sp. TRM81007]MCI2239694.1 DUF58 domain-containing protein [Kineococcus sp. TRM81007]MCI3926743.1 DUF58 domain-containing protein [Paenibacillus sp. TRM 82003]
MNVRRHPTGSRPDPSGTGGPARADLRPTARGWALLTTGLLALGTAPALGQRDLLRVGVLLTALAVLAAVVALRSSRTLDLVSRSGSGLVEPGTATTVRLTVRGRGRAPGRVVLEDAVPLALGGTARVAVPRLAEGETLDLEHRVRSDVRGSYRLGPATVRARDPFGLVVVSRTTGATATLDVLPRVHRLAASPLGDAGGSRGPSVGSAAASAPDDASIRAYRVGDDLRRVHWRSTARRGEVMVRSDEHPGHPDAVLLLDDRAGAHRGHGAASSLEWAVSAAASVAVHLQGRGHRVRLLHGGRFEQVHGGDESSAVRSLLRALARLQPGSDDGLARSLASLGRSEGTLLVAVLGDVDEADVQPLAGARSPGTPALALLQRTRLWAGAHPGAGDDAPAEAADAALHRAQLVLSRAGWRTAVAAPATNVPQAWARAARAAAAAPAGAAGSGVGA